MERSRFKVLFGLAVFTAHMPCSGVIYQYIHMQHPTTGQNLYLFGDWHFDIEGAKATYKQIDDLYAFIKSLEDPKEIIVEDKDSAHIRAAGELPMETFSASHYADLPNGIPDMIGAYPMAYMMFNTFVGIPIYNAEMRIFDQAGFPWEKVMENILSYDDGLILNELYDSLRKQINDLTQEDQHLLLSYDGHELWSLKKYHLFGIQNELLDMRILHRIYIKKSLRNIVVIAGNAHIRSIYPWLIKLGYVEKYKQGLSHEEEHNRYTLMKIEAENIKKKFSLFKNKEKEIGKLYSDFINTVAIDISKLPRPKLQAVAPQPAPVRRSKL